MNSQEAAESVKDGATGFGKFENRVALLIAVLALVLSVTGVAGSNVDQDILQSEMQASDTWAFYQAKNIRRQATLLAKDELELSLARDGAAWTADAKTRATERLAFYEGEAVRLKTEEGDGMDALMAKARAHEEKRDHAMKQDPSFDFAQGFLEIGIVLASVAILLKSRKFAVGAWLSGGIGAALAANGFLLVIPF